MTSTITWHAASPDQRTASEHGRRWLRRLDAAVLMLCGAVVHSTLMRGVPSGDAVIGRAVDGIMAMIEAPPTK
jgi:hypothetical protein